MENNNLLENIEKDSLDKAGQGKKQVLLRLSPVLWKKLALWADDDFRSINGQIEYLLSEAVKKHFGHDL